jgi:hypothetical protein
MKIRQLSDFFSIGYSSAYVHLASTTTDFSKILAAANDWKTGLDDEGLKVSSRLIDTLLLSYLSKESTLITGSKTSEDSAARLSNFTLSKEKISVLKGKCEEIIRVMMAELEDIPVFTPNEKRYSFERLSKQVYKLFRENSFEKLSEIAQYDFSEAGQCILFDRPTAAAFHSLRATESVIRLYHDKVTETTAQEHATWGDLEASLKRHVPTIDSAITEQLTHIRKRYRNQTQHPRLRYDIEEAQDLFNLCVELVNRLSLSL